MAIIAVAAVFAAYLLGRRRTAAEVERIERAHASLIVMFRKPK
jgi:hypothetical protein